MTFHHGITAKEPSSGAVYIKETTTSVIGLVAFADDADEDFFPLDTPVLITSMTKGIAKAGYEGNLRRSLETIQAITNPTVVVIRINDPFTYGEEISLDDSIVIGSIQPNGQRTGLQALLTAKSILGVTPKINIAPDVETPDVVQTLIAINKKLRAFSYISPRDNNGNILASPQDVVAYRDTLGDREIMLLYPEFISGNVLLGAVWEDKEVPEVTPIYGDGILNAAVVAAATRAKLDKEVGWHKSLSNVVLTGPTGISQPVTWDIEDPDTDAGYMNSHEITTIIQHNGIRFWGNRTPSADPCFAFEVATRTAQIIKDSIIEACFVFIDQPLTPFLAKDIIDSINAFLRTLSSGKDRRLMGGSVWYDPAENSTEGLMNGILWIDYDFTPIPPLENLGLNQRITGRYMVDFSKLIAGDSSDA